MTIPTPAAVARPGIARATLQGFLAESMVFPAGLISAAYLTRTLGPARYGAISLIYAVVSPVVWMASSTFSGRAGVKLLSDAADWRVMGATLLRASLVLGLAAMAVFSAGVPWLSSLLGHRELAPYLWLAGTDIALMPICRLHRDALTARGHYSWPAAATFTYHAARLALVLALVAAGWALWGVVLANVVARLVELCLYRWRLSIPVTGAIAGGLGPVRALIGSVFVYALCLQLFNRVDLLMLGFLHVPEELVGQYGAAQSLAQAPGLFSLVFTPLLLAALRRAEIDGSARLTDQLRADSTRLALGLFALALPVAAGAAGLARLLFGPTFAQSGPILAWLGLAGGGGLVLAVLSAHEVARGRHYRPLWAAGPMLLVAIVLQALWIPGGGVLGAARATTAAALVGTLIALGFGGAERLAVRIKDSLRAALGGAAGFGGAKGAALLGLSSPIDLLVGWGAVGVTLIAIGLISIRDLRRVAGELSGRKPLGLEPS